MSCKNVDIHILNYSLISKQTTCSSLRFVYQLSDILYKNNDNDNESDSYDNLYVLYACKSGNYQTIKMDESSFVQDV